MVSSKEIIDRIKASISNSNKLEKIELHEPNFKGSNAYRYLKECIDTGWVSSSGKWVTEFENLISDFTGSKYAIAVSNGTVALRLSLFLAGVRANDEVIIPPLTFVATANSISHLGAMPHFVDIEKETLGMCPNALDQHLSEFAEIKGNEVFNKISRRKIAAVVPVHVFGLPAKIQEIKQVCSKWNLPLIEDASEALGSKIKTVNKFIHCGCFGDIGTLSFNGNKIITSGGGGALLTDNDNFAKLAKHLSSTAKVQHPWDFYHDHIAWNDRLPNVNAAIGCAEMEKINSKLRAKRILHSKFNKNFQDLKSVEIINERNNCESNYWLITLRLSGENVKMLRDDILNNAHKLKIFLRPSWILLNELPMYKSSFCGDITEAKNQSKRLINLPSSPHLLDD
tara:strand:- start:405 stop:1595 length:1191 start_codon:yes stop_codon:yes gene_type:complete